MPLQLYLIILFVGIVIGVVVNYSVDYFLWRIDDTRHDRASFLSILLLKGRCGSDKEKKSSRYLFTELANGVLYMIVIMANGYNLLSLLFCLMTSAFLVISFVDFKTYEIPLPCNIFLGAVGVVACIFDFKNLLSHIIGFFAISIALYLLFVISKGAAIGGGDVKLMAVAGLILGWKLVILAFFLGCIIGSVCHVIRMRVSKAERVLAMGPYLCMGLWICALWGNEMISWYLGRLGL